MKNLWTNRFYVTVNTTIARIQFSDRIDNDNETPQAMVVMERSDLVALRDLITSLLTKTTQ